MTTFGELGLKAEIVDALAEQGIHEPFPVQAATIEDALAGRDTLGDQLQAQQALVKATARQTELSDLRYRNGVASYLDLLDAQRRQDLDRDGPRVVGVEHDRHHERPEVALAPEAELLRAVAVSLDCPLPPIAATTGGE